MRGPPFSLPQSGDIDVAKLARAFDDTTQCYKFLFFRALLERFNQTGDRSIPLTDILAGMIESAWWPVMHYRLTIGVGQGVHHMRELVESQTQDADERLGLLDVRAYASRLAAATIDREISRGVLRYVPFKFLSPWLDGVVDNKTNASIASISLEQAIAANLPYRFVDRRTVELGAGWARYFRANMPIIAAWADLHWLDWMQARNPNVGVGFEKLGSPPDRQSLAIQTAFLKAALSADAAPRCIFTGASLDPTIRARLAPARGARGSGRRSRRRFAPLRARCAAALRAPGAPASRSRRRRPSTAACRRKRRLAPFASAGPPRRAGDRARQLATSA
jgi:hypothetical protein